MTDNQNNNDWTPGDNQPPQGTNDDHPLLVFMSIEDLRDYLLKTEH
jgi:hypothetical protein